jgi:hypothetical protein
MNSKVIRPRPQFLTSLLLCLGFSATLVACGGDSSNSKSSPTATASAVETAMASPSAAAPVSPSAIASPIDTPSSSPIVSPTSNLGNTGSNSGSTGSNNPGSIGNNSGITGNNSGTSTTPRKRKKVKQRPAKQSEKNGVVEKEGRASTNPTRNRKSDPEKAPGALDSTPAESDKPKKNSQTKKQSGSTQKPKKPKIEKEDESNAPTTAPRSPGNSDQGSDGQ